MVDREALSEYAKEKNASHAFLAKSIGISTVAFCNKMQGKSDFKAHECKVMSDVLQMTSEDKNRIFFADNV